MVNYLRTIYQLTLDSNGIFPIAVNWWTKLEILSLFLLWPIIFLFFRVRFLTRLNFIFANTSFYFWVDNVLDLISFREVFVQKVYKTNLVKENPIIFDLGGGTGDSTVFFKLCYPKSKIFVFEPQRGNLIKLIKNTKAFSNVMVFPWAVGSKNGITKFHLHPTSSLSSSLIQRLPNQKVLKAKVVTLDRIIEEQKIKEIDLVKFDIEGAEGEVLLGFKNIRKVKLFIGELHFDLMKQKSSDIKRLLGGYKVTFIPINSQRYYFYAKRNNI